MYSWEQRKLGNIVDFLDGQRKPLKESERTKGKYPYYGASGIIDYINDYLFDENLVLLSEDGANIIDRNYPVCFIATGKYWVNNHAHVLKVKTGVIDKFICESLERLDYTKFNTGTAQPKLNQDICQKIVITIPNEDEQKCISEFLDRINNIITLHQRKLDNLKLKKKALLQKLFPKNGERYPELRFPGFTDAWEQREFSDIFSEVKSGLSRMLSNDDIGLPVVRANNINDGQLNLVDDIKYWYKNDPQGANTNNYLIEQGDILINFINSEAKMGTAAYVTRRPERDTIYTTNILRCKVNDEYNPYFIYSLTFLNSYKNYIASITKPAVNQASFTTVDFKKYSIKIPTVKEQNQIADLIETFNKLITLHQQEPFLCGNSINGGGKLC